MGRQPSYDDDDLAAAVARSTSWRGVLRELGLASSSSAAIGSVRGHADRLQLDWTHFTRRRWTEIELACAVRGARSWSEVARALGLAGGSSAAALRAHALRLGIDTQHLGARPADRSPSVGMEPDLRLLPRAASLLAAGWFTLCGQDVSWPLEPNRYDLVVMLATGPARIQVKTTTARTGSTWTVWLSTTRSGRLTYSPDEIDAFFVIDGDLSYYLIPVSRVAGLHAVHLAAYEEFMVRDGSSGHP